MNYMNVLMASFPEASHINVYVDRNKMAKVTMYATFDEPGNKHHEKHYQCDTFVQAAIFDDAGFDMAGYLTDQFTKKRAQLLI